jgi:3-oxoacyl-[acyl-carrier-protein] synthase III
MNEYVKIKGMGYATAQRRVNNTDFTWLDTSDEWITSRTGINSRYVTETENTSDMALQSRSLLAIADAGIDKRDIDTIIVATFTPDMLTPSVASILQAKLGLNDCPIMAFDLNSACTGFVMAFQTVSAFIETGRTKTALIVGAETLSKVMDWNDRGTCVLFGDGAGAFICTNQGTHDSVACSLCQQSRRFGRCVKC